MELSGADVEVTTRHMVMGVRDLVGASDGYFVLGTRMSAPVPGDPMRGWQPRIYEWYDITADDEKRRAAWYAYAPHYVADPHTLALVHRAGTDRVHLRRDLVDDRTWYACAQVNEVFRPARISDRIVGGFVLTPSLELYVGLDRRGRGRPFGADARETMRACLQGLRWLHRRVAWSYGLLGAEQALSPRERRVLRGLLRGWSEKQLAHELQISAASAHQYVVMLYRKLGVASRAELFVRWQNGGGAAINRPIRNWCRSAAR